MSSIDGLAVPDAAKLQALHGARRRFAATNLSPAIKTQSHNWAMRRHLHTTGFVERSHASRPNVASTAFDVATQPKMPPWALIMASPAAWNSGKYDAQQSDKTRQR